MSAVALLKEPCGPDDADVKEFMSGNICRCGAYPNIVAAIQQVRQKDEAQTAHEDFRISRGRTIPRRRSPPRRNRQTAQQGADVRFIAGGTTLIDLMKLNVETPSELIDINRLPLDKIEATPDGGLTIGADGPQLRSGSPRDCPQELPRPFASDPERRLGAIAEHGNDRRQSAAADALHVFSRHRHAVQQARTRQRLRRHQRAQTAAWRFWAPANIASRQIRLTCASRWPRWRRPFTCEGPRASARFRSRTFTSARQYAATRNRA